MPPSNNYLTFKTVSQINRARVERWHPGFPQDGWTGADWSNAMAGEAGETCNVVKKLRRDVLTHTKAPNGTPIHAFTTAGMGLVRELQAMDRGSNSGEQHAEAHP